MLVTLLIAWHCFVSHIWLHKVFPCLQSECSLSSWWFVLRSYNVYIIYMQLCCRLHCEQKDLLWGSRSCWIWIFGWCACLPLYSRSYLILNALFSFIWWRALIFTRFCRLLPKHLFCFCTILVFVFGVVVGYYYFSYLLPILLLCHLVLLQLCEQ